jgi:hypothetical protein
MSKVYTKNPKIEKVENRTMISCDNFLMVNYYPYTDEISHFAYISIESVQRAKSSFTVGQWRYKAEAEKLMSRQ